MRTPKKAYEDQRHHAMSREIPWLFTYESWLEMWLLSGKWDKRGKERGCYQVCRKDDKGAYSPRNCRIDTVSNNQQEKYNICSEETEAIKEMYRSTDARQWQIAQIFGISQSEVSRIISGQRRINEGAYN